MKRKLVILSTLMVSILTLGACELTPDMLEGLIPSEDEGGVDSTPSEDEGEEVEPSTPSEDEEEEEDPSTPSEDECNHDFIYIETVDPTCTTDGYDLYICSLCGDADIRNKVDALGHILPQSYTDYEEGDFHYYQCERCLEYIISSHTYSEPVVVEPTCVGEGYSTYTCTLCGHEKVETISPTGNHSYGEWVTTEPSCTTSGYRYRTCSICNDIDYEILEATGHTYSEVTSLGDNAHGTTCTVCGETTTEEEHTITYINPTNEKHTRYCEVCGYTKEEEHTLSSDTISPTCTENGYTLHTCLVCNYEYQDNPTDKLGHSFETYTDDSNGLTHTASCAHGCGESDTQYHDWGDGVVTTEPTCEQAGERLFTCKCGATKTEMVAAMGHTPSEVISLGDDYHGTKCTVCSAVLNYEPHSKVYTYSDASYHLVTCSGCEYSNSEVHDYSISNIASPTCTEKGYTYHECSLCHNSYTDSEVDALGHSYNTYTDDGNNLTHTAYCNNGCGETDTQSHDWNEGDVQQEVSCTKEGITIYTCTTCGATYQYTEEALGHDLSEYEYYSDAGHRSTCSRCGYYIQRFHSASLGENIYVKPTCTEDGYYYNYCETCKHDYKISDAGGDPALGHDLSISDGKIVCSRCDYESSLNSFSEASWDEIAFVSENGAASLTYSIGDTKDITLTTGETITMRIIGFDHDTISGSENKAGITLEMVNCLNSRHAYSGSSSGEYSSVGGWEACDLREYINTTVYNELPTEVSDNIKEVDKLTNEGYKVDETNGDTITTGIQTTSDKIFILSVAEIYGGAEIDKVGTGTSIGQYSSIYDKEGEQYAYYEELLYNEGSAYGPRTACGLLKKTYISSGTATETNWWTRTPRVENSANACDFNNSNTFIGYDNTYLTYGVCISFCI